MTDQDDNGKLYSALDELLKTIHSPGGERAPIADASEFEDLVSSLPPEGREFVTEATRFAKLWEYLSTHNIELPHDVVRAMRDLPKLPPEERVALLQQINQSLMEHENDASSDSQFRQ
jgi:hypothetical protein